MAHEILTRHSVIMDIDIGDTHLVGEVTGPETGPALVLLHSIGLSTREGWRDQIEFLTDAGWRVVSFDFRGLGESPRGAGVPSVAQFAADTVALLDALGIDRAVVMGVSLGGFVAQMLALDYSTRVRALVLVSTTCRIRAGNSGARATRNHRILADGMAVAAGPQIDSHFPAAYRAAQPDVMDWYRRHYLANDPATYVAVMENLGRFDSSARLGEIACPTLVIAGGDDTSNVAGPVPGAAAQELATAIPGARAEMIDGAHHYPHLDHAKDFNVRIGRFLAGFSD